MGINIPLNQILYGPPGTGKTYHTIDKALKILGFAKKDKENKEILDYEKIQAEIEEVKETTDFKALNIQENELKNDRAKAKSLFDYYKQQGQIEFITFHQSFSYEEFVEGIKPDLKNTSNQINYKIEDGIFKQICKKALEAPFIVKTYEITSETKVWKMSLGKNESIKKECFDNSYIKVGYLSKSSNDEDKTKKFEIEMKEGDFICAFQQGGNEEYKIDGVGIIIGGCYQTEGEYPKTRDVVWIWKDNEKPIDTNKELHKTFQKTTGINAMQQITSRELLKLIQTKLPQEQNSQKIKISESDNKISMTLPKKEPYILIIDEINRGNIAKILGELITLIEPSKRLSNDESLQVKLPYSNELFGVPSNLYIIGTMNTADRSIAMLDTALRRRFEFIEMMPDGEKLKDIWLVKDTKPRDNKNWVVKDNWLEEYDKPKSKILYNMLNSINNRIEFLLDREHTIGHSFFFEKAKFFKNDEDGDWYELTLDNLKSIFQNKIIPLLQEYFYEDYAKIDAVLNGNGMIKKEEAKTNELFSNKVSNDLDLEDKTLYKITPFDNKIWDKLETYTNIYPLKKPTNESQTKQ